MDLSIVTVTRNQFKILNKCLKSIEKYTSGLDFEMILLDNHSTTGDTEDISKNYSFVKLIKNDTNKGFAAASNQGAKLAKGEYLLFLNDDTELLENSIEEVFRFAKDKGDVIAGCKLLNTDLSHQHSISDLPTISNVISANLFLYKLFPKKRMFNKYYLNHYEIKEPIVVDYIVGAFLLCRRDTFERLGGFDTRFYLYTDEMDLCYRFNKLGGKVYYYPLTSIIHVGGATLKAESWFTIMNKNLSSVQYFQKHFKGLKFFLTVSVQYFGILIRIPLFFIIGLLKMDNYFLSRSYNFLKLLFVYPKNVFNK